MCSVCIKKCHQKTIFMISMVVMVGPRLLIHIHRSLGCLTNQFQVFPFFSCLFRSVVIFIIQMSPLDVDHDIGAAKDVNVTLLVMKGLRTYSNNCGDNSVLS